MNGIVSPFLFIVIERVPTGYLVKLRADAREPRCLALAGLQRHVRRPLLRYYAPENAWHVSAHAAAKLAAWVAEMQARCAADIEHLNHGAGDYAKVRAA